METSTRRAESKHLMDTWFGARACYAALMMYACMRVLCTGACLVVDGIRCVYVRMACTRLGECCESCCCCLKCMYGYVCVCSRGDFGRLGLGDAAGRLVPSKVSFHAGACIQLCYPRAHACMYVHHIPGGWPRIRAHYSAFLRRQPLCCAV